MSIPFLEAVVPADTSKQTSTTGFLHYIESHLEYIKRDPRVGYLEVQPDASYRALDDVYTFQRMANIPKEYWWINMRLNDLYHPNDFSERIKEFLYITPDMYSMLYSTYVSTLKRI